MRLQPIYDIAEICSRHGVLNTILCPGSRCAPLTIAFNRHPKINCKTFSDERSAGFVALGIAQQTKSPVSLVCTSGSAAYNFAPSIAEAYFQEIPLIVFTADRPQEWINQWDGQTIHQNNIFGTHVKKSYTLPEEYNHPDSIWHIHRTISEAINFSQEFPKGPVHINVPLREPLYPSKDEKIGFSKDIKTILKSPSSIILEKKEIESLQKSISKYAKVLVVGGQLDSNDNLLKSAEKFCKKNNCVLLGDIISNLHASERTIRFSDVFLGQCGEEIKKSLAPDLLITFGKSVISKQLKLFLRKYKPSEHWHIQPFGVTPDTFQSLTKVICCDPKFFFDNVMIDSTLKSFDRQKKENYVSIWKAEENRTKRTIHNFFEGGPFSEFRAIKEIIDALPALCNLHLANSMSVRYANFIGLTAKQKGIHVFSNRGTSGIDGCSSTAVGHALSSQVPNILITGDMAFFYDRNAFWHNYNLPNLHIVVINNHGGVIFNIIDGPGNLEEKNQYFVTEQKLTASNLASEFSFDYVVLDSIRKMKNSIKNLFESKGTTKILEVISSQEKSKNVFEEFKKSIKKSYNQN